MPLRMGELKCLRTLSDFVVGKETGSSVKDLKNLKFLRGELYISGLENETSSHDAGGAILSNKKDIDGLFLQWGYSFPESRNEVEEKNVLKMLQPHRNLKKLEISCYGGTGFPSWLGDPSFSNMALLRLDGCTRCLSLPSLGLLSSLKALIIRGMTSLKSIGSEFYGKCCSKPFQSLETLVFEGLQECEYWETSEGNENVKRFPCLRELTLRRCPKLSGALPNHLPLLEKLVINNCEQLVVSCSGFPLLSKLEIDVCKGMVCNSPTDSNSLKSMTLRNVSEFGNWLRKGFWLRQGFQNVEHLKIVNCDELMHFWQNEICLQKPIQGFHSLTSLRHLCIENCRSLVLFPEIRFLSVLRKLEIENCHALASLPPEMNHNNPCLETLTVKSCHSLKFIVTGYLPSSLCSISARDCQNLRCLFDDRDQDTSSSSSSSAASSSGMNTGSSLKFMYICSCPSLTSISSTGQLPTTLEYLELWGCSKLTTLSSRGQLPAAFECIEIFHCLELKTLSSSGQLPKALLELKIHDCPKLESVAEMFYNNMSLERFEIQKCENLKSFPEGLHNLIRLHRLLITDCPGLVSFPEGGFPNSNLTVSIFNCENLKALPGSLEMLNSLQELQISKCPSIMAFPSDGFPTNIENLAVDNLNIYQPLVEWGLHKLTSLGGLHITGCPNAVSFPQEEMGTILPSSLVVLTIEEFPKLKYLSSNGFQNLTSLQELSISQCPNLKSFPKAGLPSSLLKLYILDCPLLKKHFGRNKGKEWSKVAHIPDVKIDGKFIYDPQERE
ncbi:putative disease resistance protein At3g14460 [Pistacia vera]|uniref:putative disease resistance protein At3g14460 n=1 Tax=Pistacia vera TaxID=55513 RepID=UPI001262FC4F|nr:putative disease resistance protein At3g14460 [Pistacia vera]